MPILGGYVRTWFRVVERRFPDVECPFHDVECKFHDEDLCKQRLIYIFAPRHFNVCTEIF